MDLSITQLKTEREERVRDLLRAADLDALVVFSGGARGQRGNVRYLSNYSTSSQSSCVLWAREGAARLVVPYPVHRLWAEATSWIQDIQVDADYPRAIDRYLQEHGLTRGKIGWAGPPWFLEGVLAAFESRCPETKNQPVQDLLTRTRMIKTPLETCLVHHCALIADEVLSSVRRVLRPGVTERDLVADAECVARRNGAEGSSILISRGTCMAQPLPQDEALVAGDVLQFSIEPEGPGGMWIQTVRMFALGEPARDWADLINASLQGEQLAADLLKPGCPASTPAKTMAEWLPSRVPLVTPLGHGIGLDNSEPPQIHTQSIESLAAGMTIVLHPTEYGEKTAVFLGNTYLIETRSTTRLSQFPTDLIII